MIDIEGCKKTLEERKLYANGYLLRTLNRASSELDSNNDMTSKELSWFIRCMNKLVDEAHGLRDDILAREVVIETAEKCAKGGRQ